MDDNLNGRFDTNQLIEDDLFHISNRRTSVVCSVNHKVKTITIKNTG